MVWVFSCSTSCHLLLHILLGDDRAGQKQRRRPCITLLLEQEEEAEHRLRPRSDQEARCQGGGGGSDPWQGEGWMEPAATGDPLPVRPVPAATARVPLLPGSVAAGAEPPVSFAAQDPRLSVLLLQPARPPAGADRRAERKERRRVIEFMSKTPFPPGDQFSN